MQLLRAFVLHRPALAMLVMAAALCVKVLVPAGFMPGATGQRITMQICADASGHAVTREIVVPREGDPAAQKLGDTCPYGAMGLGLIGTAPPALLALALAFILLTGFAPARTVRRASTFLLRPPPCGPPLYA